MTTSRRAAIVAPVRTPVGTFGGSLRAVPVEELAATAIKAVLEAFAGRIADGDVFILSDPYAAGGNHLPDWTIIQPIFVNGSLLAFCCNRAHQLTEDVGHDLSHGQPSRQ